MGAKEKNMILEVLFLKSKPIEFVKGPRSTGKKHRILPSF